MSVIYGFGGNLSGGKTVTAIRFIVKDHLKGKKIISNIPLFHIPNVTYIESEDFVNFIKENRQNKEFLLKTFLNSSMLIDEARGLYSARRSMTNLAELTTSFIMHLGKLDCSLYYTFQIWNSQIDLQLRELTHRVYMCTRCNSDKRPITGSDRILNQKIMIKVKRYDIDPLLGIKPHKGTIWFNPQPYFKYYDTREQVVVDRDKFLVK